MRGACVQRVCAWGGNPHVCGKGCVGEGHVQGVAYICVCICVCKGHVCAQARAFFVYARNVHVRCEYVSEGHVHMGACLRSHVCVGHEGWGL